MTVTLHLVNYHKITISMFQIAGYDMYLKNRIKIARHSTYWNVQAKWANTELGEAIGSLLANHSDSIMRIWLGGDSIFQPVWARHGAIGAPPTDTLQEMYHGLRNSPVLPGLGPLYTRPIPLSTRLRKGQQI